jgi:hypothetical protein
MIKSIYMSYMISVFTIVLSFFFWFFDSVFYASIDSVIGVFISLLNLGVALSAASINYGKKFKFISLAILIANCFVYLHHILNRIKKYYIKSNFNICYIYKLSPELIWILTHMCLIVTIYRSLRLSGEYKNNSLMLPNSSDINNNIVIFLRVFFLLAFLGANSIYIRKDVGMLDFLFPNFVYIHFITHLVIIFFNFLLFIFFRESNRYVNATFSLFMIIITIIIHEVVSFLNFAAQW